MKLSSSLLKRRLFVKPLCVPVSNAGFVPAFASSQWRTYAAPARQGQQRPAGGATAGAPVLVSPSGAPIASRKPGATSPAGAEVELTPQNAAQILQNPGAILLQVGELSDAVAKKILRLRLAAEGRLPVVRLNCEVLPQVCEALQIRASPTVLLMARGQVVAALEGDLRPPTVTGFVERTAQMLGLKVDLAEDLTEQLDGAEEAEWKDVRSAAEVFSSILESTDLPQDKEVRALTGQARCALRLNSDSAHQVAKDTVAELEKNGQGRVPEVKQLAAMVFLDERRSLLGTNAASLEKLKAFADSSPADFAAVEAYAVASFWSGNEVEAFNVCLAHLRKKRSEEAKRLALALVEALGARHPESVRARRSLNNALFI